VLFTSEAAAVIALLLRTKPALVLIENGRWPIADNSASDRVNRRGLLFLGRTPVESHGAPGQIRDYVAASLKRTMNFWLRLDSQVFLQRPLGARLVKIGRAHSQTSYLIVAPTGH